jgi:predicted GIY-YIG superfamily endonuclease
MTHPYLLYVIHCTDPQQRIRSYIGITNNLAQRLRKHRGELRGGAKFTTRYSQQGCYWQLAATAHGFRDWNEVLRIEWALQHPHRSKHLKHRPATRVSSLERNLSNLFYLTHPKRALAHIWAALHEAPPTIQRELSAEYSHFLALPAQLLLENHYNAFIALRHEDSTSLAKPALQHRSQRKYTAEHYREQARALLIQSRERPALPGGPPAGRSRTEQPQCIVIN